MLHVIRKSRRNVHVCYIFYKDKHSVNYDSNEYKPNSMVAVVLASVIVCNIGHLIVHDLQHFVLQNDLGFSKKYLV